MIPEAAPTLQSLTAVVSRTHNSVVRRILGPHGTVALWRKHTKSLTLNLGSRKGQSILESVQAIEAASGRSIP